MHLPCVISDWEPVLLIHGDLCLHDQSTAEQYVEYVRCAAELIYGLVCAVFLLAKVAVKLLDCLGRPILESRHTMEVIKPFCLLHVLNVEDLVMEVFLVENKANSDAMG